MDDQVPFQEPVQASVLLGQLRQRQASGTEHRKLKTGLADIDDYLLQGGIQRGCVVGVSSGGGSASTANGRRNPDAPETPEGLGAGRLIILHVLVRALLERPSSHAAIVDATGSFPLALLARVVRWQIARGNRRRQRGGMGDSGQLGGDREESLEAKVTGVLERVSITRVFDIEGLWEVLGEVCHAPEHPDAAAKAIDTPVEGSKSSQKAPTAVAGRSASGNQEDALAQPALTPEIMDSDAEDDDLDTDTSSRPSPQTPPPDPATRPATPPLPAAAAAGPTELVLVDNLTSLIADLFARTSRAAAHALLAQLAHTLTALTRASGLTAFLLNSLTPRRAAGTGAATRDSSVFAGTTATPSLGGVFGGFADLQLMCHVLPAGGGDAGGGGEEDGVVGEGGGERDGMGGWGDGGRAVEGEGEVRFANVVEVLKDECPDLDRWEGVEGDSKPRKLTSREQRWVAFRIADGVGLANANFDSSGRM